MKKKKAKLPTVYVIAGPNGAGKTTFASEFLPGFVQYGTGVRNLFRLYRPLLDSWWLYDASRLPPQLIAKEELRQLTIQQKQLYKQIEQQTEQGHEEAN